MLSKQTLRAKLWENVRDEIGIKMEEQGEADSSKRIKLCTAAINIFIGANFFSKEKNNLTGKGEKSNKR